MKLSLHRWHLQLQPLSLVLRVNGQTVTLVTENFGTDGEGTRYTSNVTTIDAQLPFTNFHYFMRSTQCPVRYPDASTGAITFGISAAPIYVYSSGTTQATNFWACEGVQNNQPTGNVSPPTDPGYSDLKVSVKFADARGPGFLNSSGNPSSQINGYDFLRVQYSMDGGKWTTVGVFRRTTTRWVCQRRRAPPPLRPAALRPCPRPKLPAVRKTWL